MTNFQIPVLPVPEKLRFQELPACADVVMRKFPGYPMPVFLLAVGRSRGDSLELPDPIEKMVILIFDHNLESAARSALSEIAASDAKRFSKPPNPKKLPALLPHLSLRKIFECLQEARLTVFTVPFQDDGDPTPCFVAFIRSEQTIAALEIEMRKIANAFDRQN